MTYAASSTGVNSTLKQGRLTASEMAQVRVGERFPPPGSETLLT
jgi:hypothetical protein